MCNERKARARAIDLGAVRVGIYFTFSKRYGQFGQSEVRKEAFTSHYFNAEGLEVGYFNHVLESRLNQMMPPRVWGPEALSLLEFSDLAIPA